MIFIFFGAFVLLLVSHVVKMLTPLHLKATFNKAGGSQPVSFYREQIDAQKRLILTNLVNLVSKELLIVVNIIYLVPLLIAMPLATLTALFGIAGAVQLRFYGKLWFTRKPPMFTFFSVKAEPALFEHIWLEKSKVRLDKQKIQLMNRRMVDLQLLKEFTVAKKWATDLVELEESIKEAELVIKEMTVNAVDAQEVEMMKSEAEKMHTTIKEKLRGYQGLLLQLLDDTTAEEKIIRRSEEAGEKATNKMQKAMNRLVSIDDLPLSSIVRNPAVEDMIRIINAEDVDIQTRQDAEKTLKEIHERMNGEAEKRKEDDSLTDAVASIQTARKFYQLDA